MWLIGMMGSGKTTVGELAASRLGVPFYDTDRLVEDSAGKPIPDLWRANGEAVFRDLEMAVIETIPEGGLVAAGGGAVIREANRAVIARSKVVVWLRCDVEELARRARAGDFVRPLLGADENEEDVMRRLLEERARWYQSLSTHQIDTTRLSLDDAVTELVSLWPR